MVTWAACGLQAAGSPSLVYCMSWDTAITEPEKEAISYAINSFLNRMG